MNPRMPTDQEFALEVLYANAIHEQFGMTCGEDDDPDCFKAARAVMRVNIKTFGDNYQKMVALVPTEVGHD